VRLLVIEDEPKVGQALREGLQTERYEVVLAETGEDGFFLASNRVFDLIARCDAARTRRLRGAGRAPQTKLRAEDPDHSVIPAGHENLDQTRYKQDSLWFLEAWHSTQPLARLQIDHFHLSVLEPRHEQSLTPDIHVQVVESPFLSGHRDRVDKRQRLPRLPVEAHSDGEKEQYQRRRTPYE
jgi:hypothetical protein